MREHHLEDMIVTAARTAALRRVEQLEIELADMLEHERLAILWATQDRQPLPANHWHARYRVSEMLRAAKLLAAML
jgi:hypothetical protein